MRSAICFRDLKQASLYFDRVLPVAFRKMAGTGSDIVVDFPEPVPSRALINIVLDKRPDEGPRRYKDFGLVVDSWDDFRKAGQAYWPPTAESSLTADYGSLEQAYLNDMTAAGNPSLRSLFAEYAASVGIVRPDILLPSDGAEVVPPTGDPVVKLSQIPLVDAGRASWDQILELRSDPGSRIRLQRLRAFAEANYANKSISYIEDDLSSRIEDYEQASKKHGFELVTGSLSTLLDSANLQATAGATLAAAIVGGPLLAVTAATCIELSKFTLEFAKRRHAMTNWASSHPLAYMIELQAIASEA